MSFLFYPSLSTRSRRAITRKTGKFGIPYHYVPRHDLVERLADQHGMTYEAVREQLARERLELLRKIYGASISEKDI